MEQDPQPGSRDGRSSWTRQEALQILWEQGWQRLEELRATEKERGIALAQTDDQQKFLLAVARELPDDAAAGADEGAATGGPLTEMKTDPKLAEVQEASAKLSPIDRANVRDALLKITHMDRRLEEELVEEKLTKKAQNAAQPDNSEAKIPENETE